MKHLLPILLLTCGIAAYADTPMEAPRSNALEVIYEQPEGELKVYSRTGWSIISGYGDLFTIPQDGTMLEMVEAPDGKTVYIKDIISQYVPNSWVKGEKDGNTITVAMGQYVYYDDYFDEGYRLAVGDYLADDPTDPDNTGFTYQEDDDMTSVTFTIADNGTISVGSELWSDDMPGRRVLTLFLETSDNIYWSGYADWNTQWTPFAAAAATFPEGADVRDYVMRYQGFDGDASKSVMVRGAVAGDSFYLGGLFSESADSCIIGKIQGDKVTFANDQYLGLYQGLMIYGSVFTYELRKEYDEFLGDWVDMIYPTPADSLEFAYNAATGSLTAPELSGLSVNIGESEAAGVYGLDTYYDPSFTPFEDVAATPEMPEIYNFYDGMEDFGYSIMMSEIPTLDEHRNFIDPAKMSYIVYTREAETDAPQAFVFTASAYPGLADYGLQEIVELPYTMEVNGFDGYPAIESRGSAIYFYEPMPRYIGLRSIYTGGGERRESEIFWLDIEESVTVSELPASEPTVTAIYSIDGTPRERLEPGINIVRRSDGIVSKIMVSR